MMLRSVLLAPVLLLVAIVAAAQQPHHHPQVFEGTVVSMTGRAEREVPNDEAMATFFLEIQDADLARAQSLVNQRVGRAIAALKQADPKAELESAGYSAQPIYEPKNQRKLIGWRVRQNVTLKTSNLAALPKTVAAAQEDLALGGVDFQVARATRGKLEGELIQEAIADLNAKVAAAARSLDVPAARIRIEELNFGVPQPPVPLMHGRAQMAMAEAVEPPRFEPGKSTQQVSVSARVRFLTP